jgi:phosphoadenosine phosphosulfate reductase
MSTQEIAAGDAAAVAALLRDVGARHAPAVLAASLGADDMVLVDIIGRLELPIEVLTLDTGRLPEETYQLIDRVRARYELAIRVVFPEREAVEAYVRANGVNGFYKSLDLRERCCALRKTEPLKRALAGYGAWITGQRRDQSSTRANVAVEEFDARHGLAKFNPLAAWTRDDVWAYLRTHGVTYNELHDRGYASVGCAPCTRAIEPGDDERAGRWWWEQAEHRECGLHRRPVSTPIRVIA